MGRLRYSLDTNVVSYLAKNPSGKVALRFVEKELETAVSIVVACEIRFGIAKRASPELTERMTQILGYFEILPLESPIDQHYGDIRSTLEKEGTPIGPNDLLIAAHARALGLVMVTANTREFSRVPGLEVENWLEL